MMIAGAWHTAAFRAQGPKLRPLRTYLRKTPRHRPSSESELEEKIDAAFAALTAMWEHTSV